jgi:uncharacterized membrane protein
MITWNKFRKIFLAVFLTLITLVILTGKLVTFVVFLFVAHKLKSFKSAWYMFESVIEYVILNNAENDKIVEEFASKVLKNKSDK